MKRAVGIDLGTTYSLVATVRNGRAEVLREDGEGRVPSVAYFPNGLIDGAIVGWQAFDAARSTAGVLLASTKRFMGKGRADARAVLAQGARTFELFDDEVDRAKEGGDVVRFSVPNGHGASRGVTPVEVAAYILKNLRDRAEEALGEEVHQAVITVPAYFDEGQREATRQAGRLAGLDVLRLVAEPTAAAVAYGLDREAEGKGQGTYVVFDLGGGTFDVSVLVFDRGLFRVVATAGDTALGGDDFDRPIAERLLVAAGIDTEQASPKQVHQALTLARRTKEALSDHAMAEVDGDLELDGRTQTVSLALTRDDLEVLLAPVVERCRAPCERALSDAKLALDGIDGVILVGGSTRMPLVRRFVRDLFGQEPLLDAHPDEVVAAGAALQADLLTGGDRDMLLLDVTPLSLGIETMGGVVDRIIPRNAPIPCSATHSFTTYADHQTAMDIHVLQGEREKVEHCKSLARFRLRGIPPLAAGLARVNVTFALDADGLLTVTAKELSTARAQSVEVKPSYGLTDSEVEEMLLSSLDNARADIDERLLIEKRVEAARVIAATQKAIDVDGAMLSAEERARIDETLADARASMAGVDRSAVQAALHALDQATQDFARRRMSARIAVALENKGIDEVGV